MKIEVDQSGKIEQLDTPTVIACANGISLAIIIKASEKRLLFTQLRTSIVIKADRQAVIFAVLVFLLLRNLKKMPSSIILDEEYTGKNVIVCKTLEKLLMRQFKGRWQGVIRVQQIGKHSPAHVKARELHRKARKHKEVLKVTARDILRLWQ